MEEHFKILVSWVGALLLAAFQPLSVAIIVLMSAWTLNIAMGIASDKNEGKDIKLKKAFSAVYQLGFIFSVLFIISLATTGYGEKELSFTLAKWGTWVVCYFYATNIFRNGTLLWPNNRLIIFVYSFLTTEAFAYLKDLFKFGRSTNTK